MQRYVTIWFPYMLTDWHSKQQPALKQEAFVLAAPYRGRKVITLVNALAASQGASAGMTVADARAIIPGLAVVDDDGTLADRLLRKLAEWCIRFAPIVAIDPPDGLIIDASGCAHLWGGEKPYCEAVHEKLFAMGYQLRLAMAGTIGAAWALSRSGENRSIAASGQEINALLPLPPTALRLEEALLERFQKLGLYRVKDFIHMPRRVLRRRFGEAFLLKLDQALGNSPEWINPVIRPVAWQERLPCLEPVSTATAITIALEQLLEALCTRLQKEELGLRVALFSSYRIDSDIQIIRIETGRPSHRPAHLYKLFEPSLGTIAPGLGIELFVLEAPLVEALPAMQSDIWVHQQSANAIDLAELMDRLAGRIGKQNIKRYLPEAHYWPERAYKSATSPDEQPAFAWPGHRPRPISLLPEPVHIEVTAPIPDYPPMLFRYQGKVHKIVQADGPERIEQEWWLQDGEHRDYYRVEDEAGNRYWLFRLGHYTADRSHNWFLHGFFA